MEAANKQVMEHSGTLDRHARILDKHADSIADVGTEARQATGAAKRADLKATTALAVQLVQDAQSGMEAINKLSTAKEMKVLLTNIKAEKNRVSSFFNKASKATGAAAGVGLATGVGASAAPVLGIVSAAFGFLSAITNKSTEVQASSIGTDTAQFIATEMLNLTTKMGADDLEELLNGIQGVVGSIKGLVESEQGMAELLLSNMLEVCMVSNKDNLKEAKKQFSEAAPAKLLRKILPDGVYELKGGRETPDETTKDGIIHKLTNTSRHNINRVAKEISKNTEFGQLVKLRETVSQHINQRANRKEPNKHYTT